MPFGEIIATAGKWVWKFKILWVFGLLAGCSSGGGLRLDTSSMNYGNLTSSNQDIPEPLRSLLSNLSNSFSTTPGGFFVTMFILLCVLGLLFWLVGVFGKAGLARGAWLADSGAQQLEFGQLADESQQSFWRVAAINLLVGLPGFAIALIFIVIAAFTFLSGSPQEIFKAGIMTLTCVALPLCCLLVPLTWLLGILSELAIAAATGENLGVFDSIHRAWKMLTSRLGDILLMGLLILVVQIGFGFVAGLIMAPLGLGAVLVAAFTRSAPTISTGLLILLGSYASSEKPGL